MLPNRPLKGLTLVVTYEYIIKVFCYVKEKSGGAVTTPLPHYELTLKLFLTRLPCGDIHRDPLSDGQRNLGLIDSTTLTETVSTTNQNHPKSCVALLHVGPNVFD